MKEKLIKIRSRWLIAILLALIAATSVFAVDYSENGINYALNEADKTAEVTGGTAVDIIIPEKVTYDGNDYVVTSIKAKAFQRREDCKSLVLPNSLKTIGPSAFSKCSGLTGSLTLPNSLTYIGHDAFSGCKGFTGSLILPESLTSIEGGVFVNCSGFSGSLTLPNSVTSIGESAFFGCSGFTGTLTLPESVTIIGSAAFRGYVAFSNIYCYAIVPPTVLNTNAFDDYSIPLSVPSESLEAYKTADVWKNFQTINTTFVTKIDYSENGINYALNEEDRTAEVTGGSVIDIIIPEKVTYEGNDYVVTSIGAGAFQKREDCKSLVLPNSLTTIGQFAFFKCSGLAGPLTIPNSVTFIGKDAFYECIGLTGSLTLPKSLTTIGDYAFFNCSGFSGSLTIPNSVTTIGEDAFAYCFGFTGSLTLPESVTFIDSGAFRGYVEFSNIICKAIVPPIIADNTAFEDYSIPLSVPLGSLEAYKTAEVWKNFQTIDTKVDYSENGINYVLNGEDKTAEVTGGTAVDLIIPEKVTYEGNDYVVKSIGAKAFYERKDCKSLVLPNSLTAIKNAAFYECTGLTGTLTIPESVTLIDDYAFTNCGGLTGSLIIPDSVTYIGYGAFHSCRSFTGPLNLPNSLTSIGEYAFSNCSGFTGSLVIPGSVTSIGNRAFYMCTHFTGSLTIPNSVTSIGEGAFNYCISFTGSLTLPDSLTSIGAYAFNQCDGFDVINSNATVPPAVADSSAFSNYNISLNVPLESIEAYNTAEVWKKFQTIVSTIDYSENGITYALNAADKTAEVTGGTAIDIIIPEKVTYEGNDYVVKSIGKKAFMNRSDCKSLVLPNSLTSIKYAAFYDCISLTGTLTIPESVTLIDDYAFTRCGGFTGSLIIPDSVAFIGYGAFSQCGGFTGPLNLPNSLTAIGDYAFYGCQGFDSLTLSDSLTTIGDCAFWGCRFTGSLIIPESVISIGSSAFRYCNYYTGSLTLSNSLTSIGDNAFAGCTGFTGSLTLPNSLTYIGSYAFGYCSGFTGTLSIPDSMTSIENGAFYGCAGFTGALNLSNSVASIKSRAFSGCSGFEKVNCYASVPPTVADTTAFSNYNIPLNVPMESLEDYKVAEVWKEFSTIKPIGGVLVESVTLDCDKADVKVGESIQLIATVLPEDADDKGLVWTSSDETVATVDANGMVTGVAEGNATVTATASNGVSASCEVTVIPAMGIADQELLNWITPKAGGVSITIDATSDTRVDIANMAGMVVESFVVPAGTFVSTDYDAERLAPGFYVVSATSAENRITKRIVIR